MKNILLVEDDLNLNKALKFDLQKEGYHVISTYLGYESIGIIVNQSIDLIILDVNLPDISGFELIKKYRDVADYVPVLFLSACDLDEDILRGLNLGAEDYITKPFNIDIFHKKLEVILRRNRINKENTIFNDDYICYDMKKLELKINNQLISLTPTEYKLLTYFIKNKNQILTKNNIIAYLWDANNNYVDEHTLLVNISRLRNKIENKEHHYIKTVYGIGYKWIDDE